MQWGCDLADHLGIDVRRPVLAAHSYTADRGPSKAILEASRKGSSLYERFGFRAVRKMEFVFPEKFADRPKSELLFMRRPAREKGVLEI